MRNTPRSRCNSAHQWRSSNLSISNSASLLAQWLQGHDPLGTKLQLLSARKNGIPRIEPLARRSRIPSIIHEMPSSGCQCLETLNRSIDEKLLARLSRFAHLSTDSQTVKPCSMESSARASCSGRIAPSRAPRGAPRSAPSSCGPEGIRPLWRSYAIK